MAIRVQKKEKHYEAINVYRSRPAIGSLREARPLLKQSVVSYPSLFMHI